MRNRYSTVPPPSVGAATPPDEDAADTPERPSKSQLKREMLALQELGVTLAELPKDALKRFPMPETLAAAIGAARRITAHEGRRRQMQYVGKVMRSLTEEEIGALQNALDVFNGASRAETAKLHAVEHWRERLIADDNALTEFLRMFPAAEPQEGRTLIRNARREANQQKPPRYFRELFQWIKAAQAPSAANGADGDAPPANPGDDDDLE